MRINIRFVIVLVGILVLSNSIVFSCRADSFNPERKTGNRKFINAIWYNVYKINLRDEANAKKQIDGHFKKFADLKINRVFFLVKHPDGKVYFKSNFALQACNWDPFDYIIKKCRKYGMEVYPYLNIFAEEGYYLQKYPQYAEVRRDGTVLGWASPAIKNVRNRMLGMIREIIKNYKVDGLQLDRIRYPGYADVGYNLESIRLFKDKYQKEPEPEDVDFVQFRNDLITSFVEQAVQTIKQHNPALKVSAAVFHTPSIARRNRIFQQWDIWAQRGILDEVYPMSYTADPERFRQFLTENRDTIRNANSTTKLIMGIGAYIEGMKAESLQRQVDLSLSESTVSGICYFNGYSLLEDNFYQLLKNVDLETSN